MDKNTRETMKDILKIILFTICMYFGFKYNSGWSFFAAVIVFLAM